MIRKAALTILFCAISAIMIAQTWGDDSKNRGMVFTSVEKAPKFPGGISAFYQFLSENLKLPENKFSTFSGKIVTLTIIIDTTGAPVFAEIEKGINDDYDKAALAIMPKMPNWMPALQNGFVVPVRVKIPVIFIE